MSGKKRSKKVPKYTLHKSTGQARVRVNGKDVYLGVYGSAESHEKYAEVLAQWNRSNSHPIHDATIGELTRLYLEHCKVYYRKNGEMTGEVKNIRAAIRYLNRNYRKEKAGEFDTLKLDAVRESMIDAGLARNTINCHVSRLKTMFKWGHRKNSSTNSSIWN